MRSISGESTWLLFGWEWSFSKMYFNKASLKAICKLNMMLKTWRGKHSLDSDQGAENASLCLAYQFKSSERKGQMPMRPFSGRVPERRNVAESFPVPSNYSERLDLRHAKERILIQSGGSDITHCATLVELTGLKCTVLHRLSTTHTRRNLDWGETTLVYAVESGVHNFVILRACMKTYTCSRSQRSSQAL